MLFRSGGRRRRRAAGEQEPHGRGVYSAPDRRVSQFVTVRVSPWVRLEETMRLTTLFPLLVLGALVGCPQPKEDDTASADTDTDTDADADADTDADVTEVDAAAAADIDGATAGYEYAYDVMLDATMDGSSLDGTLTYT